MTLAEPLPVPDVLPAPDALVPAVAAPDVPAAVVPAAVPVPAVPDAVAPMLACVDTENVSAVVGVQIAR